MQSPDQTVVTSPTEHEPATSRRLRSLVLAWRDEESGDELTIDVRGSERFLEGLRPLGFVPVGDAPRTHCERDSMPHAANALQSRSPQGPSSAPVRDPDLGPSAKGSLAKKDLESADHRVRWTVRLSRPWKPKSR